MSEAAIYENVWLRRVPKDWKGRSDIRPSVIANEAVTIAIFALPDKVFLFVPMANIRAAVAGLAPGDNGSLIFTIDTKAHTISSKLRMVPAPGMEVNFPKPKPDLSGYD